MTRASERIEELARELAEAVCHDEQMTIWTDDLAMALSMGNFLRDDLAYDEVLKLHAIIGQEIRHLIASAFDHPKALTALRSRESVKHEEGARIEAVKREIMCQIGVRSETTAEIYAASILKVADQFPHSSTSQVIAEGCQEPDFVYDHTDWEVTHHWEDRDSLTNDLPVGDMQEFSTLIRGPRKWAAHVVVTRDDEGDPDETELRWFDSEEAAKEALGHPVRDLFDAPRDRAMIKAAGGGG